MIHAYHLGDDLDRAFEIEALARANVQSIRNSFQILLAMLRQISTFEQVLTNQTIDIFVAAALLRAVRVTKVNRRAGLLSQVRMFGHLASLTVGHAFAHHQRHAVQRRAEPFDRRRGSGIAHLDQHQIATGALHKRADRRRVVLAFDQIAFPVAWHLAIINLRRPNVNAHHIGYLTAPINTTATWPPGAFPLAQTQDQLLA